MKRFAAILFICLMFPAVALADDPITVQSNDSVWGFVKDGLEPVVDVLDDFAAISTATDYSSVAEETFGLQWRSVTKTDSAFNSLVAPSDYYSSTMETELRNAGYTMEQMGDLNTGTMAPLDFASWLGGFVAIPFLYVRGFQTLGDFIGPLELIINWLLITATWVTFVRFIEFMAAQTGNIIQLGRILLHLIEIFKP